MNRTIYLQRIFLYYDGPQLFCGKDDFEKRYLFSLSNRTPDADVFVGVPITTNRFLKCCTGEEDISDVFSKPEEPEYLVANISNIDFEQFSAIVSREKPNICFCPDPGLYLEKIDDLGFLQSEAIRRNRGVFELLVSPPEAMLEPKISASYFGGLLTTVQNLFRHIYKRVCTGSFELDDSLLDFYLVKDGSFRGLFLSRSHANLLGASSLRQIVKKLETIVASADSEMTIQNLSEIKGHAINSYKGLCEIVLRSNMPITIGYSDPEFSLSQNINISKSVAEKHLLILSEKGDLTTEDVTVLGKFFKVDAKKSTWSIQCDDRKNYSGTCLPENGNILNGIVINRKIYTCLIEERIEEVLSTGKEKISYLLKRVEEISA